MNHFTHNAVPFIHETPDYQCQYLVFTLHQQLFAVGILEVKEIIAYDSLTEVPTMPHAMRGVLNLRGLAVPVIDLSAALWKPRIDPGKRTCIVIVELNDGGNQRVFGILVDTVNRVVDIPHADIEAPPGISAKIRTDIIAGMGKLDQRFLLIINARRVFAMN